ncbi:MAG: hypothetical protein ACR2HG_13740 [Pyrinomonadaceae bacterium]
MNEINCENWLMAKMAELDGEKSEIFVEAMNSHLSVCENCRMEFEQMQNVGDLLKSHARREPEVNLWLTIEERIGSQNSSAISWKPFVFIGAILVGYKLLEMLPERSLGLTFQLVPLIFMVALFVFLKENPFKINAELGLER